MGKKFSYVLLLALLAALSMESFAAQTQKPRFYVKFSGTAVFSSAGDFGDFVDKNDPTDTARSYFRGYGGEIGLETKKHSVGISAGYTERYLDISSLPDAGAGTNVFTRHSFSAVPIFLFIRYKLVNGSFFKASLTLGEGVYLATYKEKLADTVLLKSRKNNLGFHGGVSVDLNIFKFLDVFVDAGYRLVSFKEMVGKDYRTSGAPLEGSFYYQANEATGEYGFFIKTPNKTVAASRSAVLNLKGFTLSTGLKIIF
ncbi:MAG: hypothetical protein QG657_1108 [Acidobacteriota bacterium]|nr:hypothetical protein [Acidobacteriota bacterium]